MREWRKENKPKANDQKPHKITDTKLIRQELPIQSIYQRNNKCTATVPVHLDVMKLSTLIRTDLSLLDTAVVNVQQAYNEDMERYLNALKSKGRKLPWLRGYEKFSSKWHLHGIADRTGFLTLTWTEGDKTHSIRFIETPVILHNQHDEYGRFHARSGPIEILYRNITDPDCVYIGPEKMRYYGVENGLVSINEEEGMAEVMGHAFCSDHFPNIAKTLLLRDFAVFYLNRLLEKVEENVVVTAA